MHITPMRYGIGGKTGTAEFRGQEDYGWFVGYAPLDDPRIVVALVVEEGEHGSTIAPIAKTILEAYLDETGAPLLQQLARPGPGSGPAVTRASRPLAEPPGGTR
jgi:cell division protein FtsI/penicillin-binding protein 2